MLVGLVLVGTQRLSACLICLTCVYASVLQLRLLTI